MTDCVFCDDLANQGEGVWMIYIYKEYWRSHGKKFGPICHDCLADELIGVHTGGGLTGNMIKKIKRVKNE